jgi:hypothetical protein
MGDSGFTIACNPSPSFGSSLEPLVSKIVGKPCEEDCTADVVRPPLLFKGGGVKTKRFPWNTGGAERALALPGVPSEIVGIGIAEVYIAIAILQL